MRVFSWLCFLSSLLLAAIILGGVMGGVHPIGDSLAVLRLPAVATLAIVVIWSVWPRALRWTVSALCLGTLGLHLWNAQDVAAQDAEDTTNSALVLYQQNLNLHPKDRSDWLAHIAQLEPDVLTLQEVSDANLPLLAQLATAYPYQHRCPLGTRLGEAVVSRFPIVEGSAFCTQVDALSGVQILSPQGRIWVVSAHLRWPWPHTQAAQLQAALPSLRALDGAVVVAGDFNAVAWSHTIDQVEAAIDGGRVGPWRKTFDLPRLGLPIGIDHVVTNFSGPAFVAVQPKLGSDHNGLLAHIASPSRWPE